MMYILFILCVLGFSVTACLSDTADTYLRDKNPHIWCWNWTLFVFAVVFANFVRLPLGLTSGFGIWAANFAICLVTGLCIFFTIVFCSLVYHIAWPLFQSLFYSEN